MNTYKLDIVNFRKLYFYSFLILITSVLVTLLFIFILIKFIPSFKNISFLLIIFSIIFGIYSQKYSYLHSIKKIEININDNKLSIDSQEILIDNIEMIKINIKTLNHYPKLFIIKRFGENIILRVSKEKNYYDLLFGLKSNKKLKGKINF